MYINLHVGWKCWMTLKMCKNIRKTFLEDFTYKEREVDR